MSDASDRHNAIVGPIVSIIVKQAMAERGRPEDALVMLESVIVGVCLLIIRLGGDNSVLDTVIEHARCRLAEIRLADIKPDGTA